jgi:8-oxo-dGTP pyrophosphatase MutT (NUDIX family)
MTDIPEPHTIHKAAGLIVRDRKVLVSRNQDKVHFIQPGGKLEPGESSEQALIRELHEEQGVVIEPHDLTYLGTFHAIAAGHEHDGVQLTLDAYLVAYDGPLQPDHEIAENRWIGTADAGSLHLASIMEHDILPLLKARNLID